MRNTLRHWLISVSFTAYGEIHLPALSPYLLPSSLLGIDRFSFLFFFLFIQDMVRTGLFRPQRDTSC